MLAGIESATSFPRLSLIAFATSSHAVCLREEITTLAPCSAIRSAIARPMPRDDPVMTATFPDISNKVMLSPLGFRRRMHRSSLSASFRNGQNDRTQNFEIPDSRLRALRNYQSSQLRFHDLRSRWLMHRPVRCISNPRLLVHHGQSPCAAVRACEMIKPRHRTIVDIKGKTFLGLAAQRQSDRRLDRAAMTNRNYITTRVFNIDALDRAADAIVQIHKTFAARCWLADIGKPV